MEAILLLLGRADNIAVLVLLAGCIGLGYLHVVWRREERADRQRAYEVVERNTEALNGVRNALSALTGKPL